MNLYFLKEGNNYQGVVSGTDVVESYAEREMASNDRVGVQLIVDPYEVPLVLGEGDGVDGTAESIEIAAFDFTGLEGGTVTIAGSEDNDGTYPIATGADGSAVLTGDLTDEVFDIEAVTVTVTYPLLEGSWAIEISNDYRPASSGGSESGHWTDITAEFAPSIVAVSDAVPASYSQYVQADLAVGAIKFTFTATGGSGYPIALGHFRSWV